MLSVLFGLASALTWGAGDFAGGIVSRRTQAARATLYVEAVGLFIPLLAAFLSREAPILLSDWLWCGAAGTIGSLGLLALYHALAQGQMSIAAPVSGVTAAGLPVVIGVLIDGLPDWPSLAGFVLALAAIWLVSQSDHGGRLSRLRFQDLRFPLLAGLGFSVYFVFIHQGSQVGLFWPMVASRFFGTLTLIGFAAFAKQIRFPGRSLWPVVGLNALLDVGGNAFFILAGQTGRLDVAAVLSSLYPGGTVVLAWLFLRETISPRQLSGILMALAAIALMTI